MLIAGAVCPHPPLLIPAALGSAASDPPAELREVASAAALAVSGLAGARPDVIVVVGGGAAEREYGAGASGGLHAFGIGVTVGPGEPVLPLSLTVGSWLLRRAGLVPPDGAARPGGRVGLRAVARATPAADCLRLGAAIARQAPRVAMLAMGDGPARRAAGVPGAADPAADRYDAEVAAALAEADPARLARLAPALDDELMVAGRAAWQVLAGAADGARLRGRLRCATTRYEVSYLVASWDLPG